MTDLTGQELHVIAFLSSAEDTLRRAKDLLSLAETNSKNARTLAACATVLLAAALEQAVKTKLSEAAETSAFENDIETSATRAGEHDDASIWWRVQQLPSVLTDGKFRFARNHHCAKALSELIRTRNKLVHVNEPAVHLIGPDDQIKIEEGGIRVNFWQPLNPWGSIKIEQAMTFQTAVETYFSEVLFPESGKIKAGDLVVPRV